MLRKYCPIFAIVVVIIAIFWINGKAQSQLLSQTTGELRNIDNLEAVKKKTDSHNDQLGTEQSPLVIKVAPSPNAQEEVAQAKRKKKEQATTNRRAEITTYIIAGATGIQAIALIWTVFVMVRTTPRQLRAYIFVDKAVIANVANPLPQGLLGGKFEETPASITRPLEGPIAYLEFKNSGQTPAYEVTIWGNMCVREFPLTYELPDKKPDKLFTAKASVPPSGGTNKSLGTEHPLPEEINKLRTIPPTTAIYIYGTIFYKDTFGKKRFTNYRYFHNDLSGILGRHTGVSICNEGNEAN